SYLIPKRGSRPEPISRIKIAKKYFIFFSYLNSKRRPLAVGSLIMLFLLVVGPTVPVGNTVLGMRRWIEQAPFRAAEQLLRPPADGPAAGRCRTGGAVVHQPGRERGRAGGAGLGLGSPGPAGDRWDAD